MGGIDGKVELFEHLEKLSEKSMIARNCPRGNGLVNYLSTGIEKEFAASVNSDSTPY